MCVDTHHVILELSTTEILSERKVGSAVRTVSYIIDEECADNADPRESKPNGSQKQSNSQNMHNGWFAPGVRPPMSAGDEAPRELPENFELFEIQNRRGRSRPGRR